MSAPQTDTSTTAPAAITTMEEAIEQAKRAFALRKYEQSVDHYATALEFATAKYGEGGPEMADLYFAYGKALLENAIAQTSVLGKEQAEDAVRAVAGESETAGPGKFLSFSGDADEDAEPIVPGSKEDVPFDLFGEAQKAAEREEEEEEEEGDEEGEDAEPEDDFNAAWEVLDLARALFEKQQDAEGDAVALKLADTFLALGDVSLETEKFEQAIADYGQALALKVDLLPQSSRQIAEAHYKLSIVLDLTSGRLNDAITHAERALDSVEARLAELRDALSGQGLVTPVVDEKADPKGKAKAKGPRLLGDDAVQHLNRSQMEAEVKELQGLKEDLALKVEELKTSPEQAAESAPAMVARVLDSELNAKKEPAAAAAAAPAPQQVNDLTSMVKKKKKDPEANGIAKRKAEDEPHPATPSEKKAKVDAEGS